jgi:tetratricopeptide (TPR) repeat protein
MKDASLIVLVLIVPMAAIAAAAIATDSNGRNSPPAQSGDSASAAAMRVGESSDARILFNRGCRSVARGERDEAIELFARAGLCEDEHLAARSHYNLGTIAAQEARDLFGSEPATASGQVRREGLALLAESLAHYRDALDLDPAQIDARYNLELIRLWIQRMEVIWRQRDRREQRRQLGLLELLKRIEADQRQLRAQSLVLTKQPDSAERRERAYELGALQQLLSEELGTLTKKILADRPSIRDVILFPHRRPDEG